MSPGSAVRAVIGDRLSRIAGDRYRALFVDLAKVAMALSNAIPQRAHVLDVGGGDGAPLNYLLKLRPDICITTIDLGRQVGQWIHAEYSGRVLRLPQTSIRQYFDSRRPDPHVLLLSDVVHHIPTEERDHFFTDIFQLVKRCPQMRIVVKDVEPGYLRSKLGFWSDKYITGDRKVSLISREQLGVVVSRNLGSMRCHETGLFKIDAPNYAVSFFR